MKKMFLTVASLLMIVLCAITAEAADRITKVSISVKDIDNGVGVVYGVDVTSGYYSEIESCEQSSYPSAPGKTVTLTVVVAPKEGYVFTTSGTKKTKVEVSGATLASYHVDSTKKLTARINYKTKMTLPPVEAGSLWMGEDGTTLHWDKVDYCSAYRVNLSGGTNLNVKVTDQLYVDLGKYVTSDLEGTKVKIQATSKNETQAKYLFDSVWTNWGDGVEPYEGNTTAGVFEGQVPYLRFKTGEDEDGLRWYATGWQRLGKVWFYFDGANRCYAKTGWFSDGGKWYYLDPATAVMQTGWVQIPKTEKTKVWYFFGPNGDMQTGWVQDSPGGKWYYLAKPGDPKGYPTGEMYANDTTPDGYRVGADGAWIR